jgi:hypothetical protein
VRTSAQLSLDLKVRQNTESGPAPRLPLTPTTETELQSDDLEQHRRRLAMELRMHTGHNVALLFHTNRQSMLTAEKTRLGYLVRAHRIFAFAPPDVIDALARFVNGNDRGAAHLIDRFIDVSAESIALHARPSSVRTEGRFFDLMRIFDELNAQYFDHRVACRITWGKGGGSSKRRRSIKLGSYHANERLIRIHPALDQSFVPSYFISFVVFHEMLHEQLGISEGRGGRRAVHPPEFRALEARYPYAQDANAWEKANIHALLRFKGD